MWTSQRLKSTMDSDRNPNHLYGPFRLAFERVLEQMQEWLNAHHAGVTCKMIEGYRSAGYQAELYSHGRNGDPRPIVTWRDGSNQLSDHQSSLAGDIGFFDEKGAYIEEPGHDFWLYYGHLVRAMCLEWGGTWHKPDEDHAQWPEGDHQTYASARQWQRAMKLA